MAAPRRNRRRLRQAISLLIAVAALGSCAAASPSRPGPGRPAPPGRPVLASAAVHLEYVFEDDAAYVYDLDHGLRAVGQLSLPGIDAIRGVAADIPNHMLYISHGGDGDGNGNGALAAYDLLRNRIVWDRHFGHGIDSLAISRNGRVIYLPDGELTPDGIWYVLSAGSGRQLGEIHGGMGAHNTIVGRSGRHVYLGGRDYPYLDVASTRTLRVTRRVGPLRGGVRPFTINGRETLAYTTATGVLGFQVSSLRSGHVLYTVGFGARFPYDPATWPLTAPSHGIALTPGERQLWVIDTPNDYIHAFDVRGLPHRRPRRLADIRLSAPFSGRQSGCSQDCERDGWVQSSLSGCQILVGDTGDVISTRTLRIVGELPALRDSRQFLEIDWRRGRPVATSTRSGLGYVTRRDRSRHSCA